MVRVKLLDNLTRYDKRLTIGEIGTVIDPCPNRGDRFATVRFNNGACLDVLWKGLERSSAANIYKRSLYIFIVRNNRYGIFREIKEGRNIEIRST